MNFVLEQIIFNILMGFSKGCFKWYVDKLSLIFFPPYSGHGNGKMFGIIITLNLLIVMFLGFGFNCIYTKMIC